MKKTIIRTGRKALFAYRRSRLFYQLIGACILLLSADGCRKEFEPIITAKNSSAFLVSGNAKPNIILIIANDFGFELPTYNGGQSYSTPSLDFLAANGMHFKQCYNHPDGSPSRIATLTGKYNFRNYVVWGVLPPTEKTIGNMLKDAGYATCWVGKWQLSGDGPAIRGAGFGKYRVFLPSGHGQRKNRYKSPRLYENDAYLPDSATKGKYSEDMCFDYFSNFVDDNTSNPFFAMYATLLPAQPFVPTPDDPDYTGWNPASDNILDDQKYYPGMVSYIDKIVGKIRQKLIDNGIAENTVIFFTSATQTDPKIVSLWRGQSITGTKVVTNRYGTNIPLLAYWPNIITLGKISNTLVDFTDFMPTMAEIAGIPTPTIYGTLDGKSFYDNMLNIAGTNDRDWVFCHWDNNPLDGDVVPPERFINNALYKLYDTIGEGNGKFYNIRKDPGELNPIPDDKLTPAQLQRKIYFRGILDTMHK